MRKNNHFHFRLNDLSIEWFSLWFWVSAYQKIITYVWNIDLMQASLRNNDNLDRIALQDKRVVT